MMYGKMSLVANSDGTYDLIIQYDRGGAEFGLDFLSGEKRPLSYKNIKEYLELHAKGLKMRTARIVIGGLIVATMSVNLSVVASAYADSRYTMGYLYHGTESQQIEYVKNAQDTVKTVSPSYFDIKKDGSLKFNMPSARFMREMQEADIRVVPFLSNHWDRQAGMNALENSVKLVEQLADYIRQYELDGINVDIENLTAAQRDSYSNFVVMLRQAVPAEKEVSVAVAANPWGWNTGWHGSYDYAKLAEYSDYLMLMTYDEHYEGGDAGPVAGISFVEDSIKYALSHTTPDKIVIGMPLFGRVWSKDESFKGSGVPLAQVEQIIETYNAAVVYDENSASPKAEFTVQKGDPVTMVYGKTMQPGEYVIWYEDNDSLRAKLELTERYNLKGSSWWALGQENPSLWNIYSGNSTDEQVVDDLLDEVQLQETEAPAEVPEEQAPAEAPAAGTVIGGSSQPRSSSRGGGGSSGGGYRAAAANTSVAAMPESAPIGKVVLPKGTVKAENAALRAAADSAGSIVAALQAGAPVTVTGEVTGWYRVKTESGTVGYLLAEQLEIEKRMVLTGKNAWIFEGPALTAKAQATIKLGDIVTVLADTQTGWSSVRLENGQIGYLPNKALTKAPINFEIVLKTTSEALKLRAAPAVEAATYGTVPKGEHVVLLGTYSGYYLIAYGNAVAYVTGGYLQ